MTRASIRRNARTGSTGEGRGESRYRGYVIFYRRPPSTYRRYRREPPLPAASIQLNFRVNSHFLPLSFSDHYATRPRNAINDQCSIRKQHRSCNASHDEIENVEFRFVRIPIKNGHLTSRGPVKNIHRSKGTRRLVEPTSVSVFRFSME